MYSEFGIKNEILELSKEVEKECVTLFQKIEEIKEINSLKVFTPFIKPIVPIDIKSTIPIPVFSNFLEIYTTNLKFLSTKTCLASKLSSSDNLSI